jgi:hypothetical protein
MEIRQLDGFWLTLQGQMKNTYEEVTMKFQLQALGAVLIFGSVSLTMATPSTQIWIPSTDVQAFMNPHIGWDAYLNMFGHGNVTNAGITMGVLPFSKVGLEVGIDYRDGINATNGNHDNPLFFNAKIGVPEDSLFKFQPAIAVGIYDAGLKEKAIDNRFNVTYGLLAKNIWKLGRFSVGGYYGAGPSSLWVGTTTGDTTQAGLLASWDRTMSEISDKLWLAVDYQSGKNAYGAFSFGLAWNWSSNVSTILAYDIYNDDSMSKPAKSTITFQVDINMK